MLFRNKKLWLVLGLIGLMAVLSGCAPTDHTTTTEDLLKGNFWEKNVVYWFALMLDTFAEWFTGSYGLSILLLTIIVRTLILPLTLKQYRSSKAMQAIQPEMQKIRQKFKDNPQKQQEETMKLFQQHQINPLAGCLPLLIQMPIFIALYNAIYWNPDIRTHEFLWLQLGEKDPYYILPIIAAITTFIQSKMMPQQPNNPMQAILLIFPVLIFVMAMSFPAALPLYWIYSNIYTIIQNYFLYVRSSDKGKEAPAK
ncbi:YidC/Oxa1 family membrane protein insertase [Paenibacillus tarimensis]|uniref:YidC/Oxa1 family membrane protein insertase n=1 Tax=Paenibacillus tarimensis TaxID=416012 RepID=UPI001F25228E|nr:membrane protein insertase YidC [Paenibacillus tarimensis]MCF2944540.1 membrane protein insertase YidC [Paenibacillus tarimensis]